MGSPKHLEGSNTLHNEVEGPPSHSRRGQINCLRAKFFNRTSPFSVPKNCLHLAQPAPWCLWEAPVDQLSPRKMGDHGIAVVG